MNGIETPDRATTDRIRDQFESYGFTVTVGG